VKRSCDGAWAIAISLIVQMAFQGSCRSKILKSSPDLVRQRLTGSVLECPSLSDQCLRRFFKQSKVPGHHVGPIPTGAQQASPRI
jgi:hypothetical protein